MLLRTIRKKMNSFSQSQLKIAQYILSQSEAAAFLTAAKLAEAADVSEATVIRFVNFLGYSKYSGMQKDLQGEIQRRISQTERFIRSNEQHPHSSMMQSIIRSMRTDAKSIERTLNGIDYHTLERVVGWIANSQRVFVVGTHSEYGIACYFSSTLCWIRDGVSLVDEGHSPEFDSLAEITKDDVIVAISSPPYPMRTVQLLDVAVARGAKSIAITDAPESPLAMRADCTLFTQDEKLSFADNIAPTASLLSALLALVSAQNFETSSARLKSKQRYWEEIGFYVQQPSEWEE